MARKASSSRKATESGESDWEALRASMMVPTIFMRPTYSNQSAWHEHVPFAFWLVAAQKPQVLVELGTHHGVSYFAFCQAVQRLGLTTRCFAVDSWKGDEHAGFYGEEVFNNVKSHNDAQYSGFSRLIRSTFDAALDHFSDGQIDLLHIDGLHTFEAIQHDFESWLPKLSERGVVVLHDTNVRERNFGVFRLFEELKTKYPAFEFVHGHGLGILGIGKSQNKAMKRLFEAEAMPEARLEIHDIFSRLGRGCADAYFAKDNAGRVGKLKKDVENHKKATDDLKAVLEKTKQELKAHAEHAASMKKNAEAGNQKASQLQAELEKLAAQSRSTEKDLGETKAKLAEANGGNGEQAEKAKRLEQQLAAARQENAAAQQKLAELDSGASAQQDTAKRLEQQLAATRQEHAAAQAKVAELDGGAKEQAEKAKRLEQQLAATRQENAAAQQKLAEFQQEIERLSDTKASEAVQAEAQARLAEAEAKLAAQRQATKKLDQELALARQEGALAKDKVSWLQDELDKRATERAATETARAEALAAVAKLEAVSSEQASKFSLLGKDYKATLDQMADAEQRHARALADLAERDRGLDASARLAEELKTQIARLEAAGDHHRQDLQRLEDKLANELQERAGLHDQIGRLQGELQLRGGDALVAEKTLQETRLRLSQVEISSAERQEQARRLEETLANQLQERTGLQKQLADLQAELELRDSDAMSVQAALAEALARQVQMEQLSAAQEGSIRRLEDIVVNLDQAKSAAEARVEWLQSELVHGGREVESAVRAASETQSQLALLEGTLATQQDTVAGLEAALAGSHRQRAQAEEALGQLSAQIVSKTDEVASLFDLLADKEEALRRSDGQVRDHELALDALQRELQQKLRDNQVVETTLAELRHRLAQTESALAQRRHEAEETGNALEAARRELAATLEDLGRVNAANTELEKVAAGFKEHFDLLMADAKDAKLLDTSALQQERIAVAKAETDLAAARKELAVARAELTRSADTRAELETIAAGLKEHVTLLMADVKTAKSETAQARNTSAAELQKIRKEAEALRTGAEAADSKATAKRKTLEAGLRDRFQELATLTGLLREASETARHKGVQVGNVRNAAAAELGRAIAALLNDRRWSFLSGRARLRRKAAFLTKSGLFDAEWYLRRYQDVSDSGVDPAMHYIEHGMREGREPNATFALAEGDYDAVMRKG